MAAQTLSGKQALAEIDDVLRKARGNLGRVDAEFGGARDTLARLKHREVSLYAELARLRLLAIEQGNLLDALDAADRKAHKILEERVHETAKLDERIDAAEIALEADEARRADQQRIVEAASEALDAAEAEAQAALEADEAYRAQLARTEHADFIADQAEDKAAAAQSDRAVKGKPYEDDPLFCYLWERGYGTSRYRAWPVVRWIDGKVAKLCGFEPARRNYALLIEIPVRLAEHAARMRADFEREAESLAVLEEAAADAARVPELKNRLVQSENDLDAIDDAIAEKEEALRGLIDEREAFAVGEDALYKNCVDVLSGAMQRGGIRFVRQRAARTRDPADDTLVERLADVEDEIVLAERNLAEFRRLHEHEGGRLRKLEDVRRRFKAERYDDPLSEFVNGALIALVLRQFLGGTVGSGDVWDTIKRQHRRKPAHANPNFGTMRFPKAPKHGPWRMPSGGFGRGGGFGGGGFRSGGGFKGGGFKTGGGF